MLTLLPLAIDALYRAYKRRQCLARGQHRWRADGLTCADCGTSPQQTDLPEIPVSGFAR